MYVGDKGKRESMNTRQKEQKIFDGSPLLHIVENTETEDPIEFDTLFNRFSSYVAAVAFRLLGRNDDVDDIVQEVFWDCSRQMNQIHDMSHARRWLVKVTVRKSRRLLRKRRLLSALHLRLFESAASLPPRASADDRATLIQLYAVLDMLPPDHRIAWTLRYLHGAELCEVAEACGCSLATAKRRIRAAHDAIKGGELGQ